MTVRAVVAAGSNLGDRLATIARGLRLLAVSPQVRVVAVSPVYETAPVGGPPQGDYLNCVALADTELDPPALLGLLHVVEAACGRERDARWGARTLDLDLIAYGDLVRDEARDGPPVLPHPRAADRAFVLAPLADVAPGIVLPGYGVVADLLAALGTDGVVRRNDLVLTL